MNTDAQKLIKEIKTRSLQAIHSYTTQTLIKRNNVKSILSSLRERKKRKEGTNERRNEGRKIYQLHQKWFSSVQVTAWFRKIGFYCSSIDF